MPMPHRYLGPEGYHGSCHDREGARGCEVGGAVAEILFALAGVDYVVVSAGLEAGFFVFSLVVATTAFNSGFSVQPHLDLLAVHGAASLGHAVDGVLVGADEVLDERDVVLVEVVRALGVDLGVAGEALERGGGALGLGLRRGRVGLRRVLDDLGTLYADESGKSNDY